VRLRSRIFPILVCLTALLSFGGDGSVSGNGNVAWAGQVQLFQMDGLHRQVGDYIVKVNSLEPGDELIFSNGKKVTIGKLLGSGNMTLVFEIAGDPGQVLRIPKSSGEFRTQGASYSDFVNAFLMGNRTLKRWKIPSVEIIDAYPGQYVIAERIPTRFTFTAFLENYEIPPPLRKEMKKALVEFARKTAPLETIGDFHSDQLVYVQERKEWVLLDWTDRSRTVALGDEKSIHNAGNAFLSKKTFGGRANFFEEFAEYAEDSKGIHWFPTEPRYRWVSELAAEIQHTIETERINALALAKSRAPGGRCVSTFLESMISGRR